MKRSLAWDQGKEIHGHEALARSAGLVVYVCNPHSPWQRGSNENTNGLLRQWFPRSTDFYLLDRQIIAAVQTSLNDRPRHTLGVPDTSGRTRNRLLICAGTDDHVGGSTPPSSADQERVALYR